MSVKINSANIFGIEGKIIDVEVDISRGIPSFNIVGLADIAVREAKERVRAAIVNSGFLFPLGRITVNLSPADMKKEGALLDLPIAIGILAASSQVFITRLEHFIVFGELSLDGSIKKIKGALAIVLSGAEQNKFNFIVPSENSKECSLIKRTKIYPFENLNSVVMFLNGLNIQPYLNKYKNNEEDYENLDFSDVSGQEGARRAVEVAASGNHGFLLYGPPGCGKSMIAKRLPSILPRLSEREAIEVTKIYSIYGNLNDGRLIHKRPFRSPHHSASSCALSGGGLKLIPGEVTLAHRGVLFLDEILEFKRNALEVLRQPIEEGQIIISRGNGRITYPCKFLLIGAMNPCSCGFYLSGGIGNCTCTDSEIKRYQGRLSGPLLNRIDLFVPVNAVDYNSLKGEKKYESSKAIKERVLICRETQMKRYKNENIDTNSELEGGQIKKYCKMDNLAEETLENFFKVNRISLRAINKIVKVSRTIADLNGSIKINRSDVIEALNYRKYINNEVI